MSRIFTKDESANLLTIRDPMILVVDDTYYLTGTQPPYWKGPNDGVHLWSSKDLVNFTDHGLIIKRDDLPESAWCRDRFWAPELFDGKDGWFYVTFNCRNESEEYKHIHSVGLARSRSITGPYEIMTLDKPLAIGNDATLFRDDDGTTYLGHAGVGNPCEGNPGAKILLLHKIDLSTGRLYDTITVCESDEGSWDEVGIEGQCIIKRDGIYYQWYSSWTNGYSAGLMSAESISGPWKQCKNNPILKDGALWHHGGHNHSFRGLDGKDYVVFHASVDDPASEKKEQMIIRPVKYTPDGGCEIE